MTTLIRQRPLAVFFVLAYLGSWIVWSPWWLSQSGIGVIPIELPFSAIAGINQLGLFAGPFAAALIVTTVTEGRDGRQRLLRRIVQWRVHPIWYLLALVIVPLATGAGYLLIPGASLVVDGGSVAVIGLLASTYLIYLLGGPLQEEPGWRGFALPRLQARLHPTHEVGAYR